MTYVLGIDPNTKSIGYYYARDDQTIVFGTFTSRKRTFDARLAELKPQIRTFVHHHPIDILAIEEPYVGRNKQAALKVSRVAHIIEGMVEATWNDVRVMVIASTKAKRAVTGRGDASKDQVAEAAMSVLGYWKDINDVPRDISDAWAVYVAARLAA